MQFEKKDILDMESLSADEINLILDTADKMKEISDRSIKKVPTLRGKTMVLFFYEPSTRTRLSFDIAAKRLSADSLSLSATASSTVKGETLVDTARNLEAMRPDVIVIRHPMAGAPHMIAKMVSTSVINAGDGMHAHPSQSLLDIMTVREKKGSLDGLRVAIIGDISHSRVARSNIAGFSKLGANVILSGPPTMIPKGIEALGASVVYNINDAISGADVVMMLRIQKERQKSFLFPSEREYARFYGLSADKLKNAKEDVLIMHPGPLNRGVEIAPDVADGPHSIILEQVTNGVAIRMAMFYLLSGGVRNADDN
ncbi:MAG: aspartate carbamoyltransferase catalytic subunit [Desulfobacterales bacterium]|jgi:aspartate carbamoyltransferase catalytic subunit|nr:aspartate carbamoyltransferase catalytic subunit [Desulfobacteraceae bacterium]MBT4363462.1 aspartate carbamoyltransferase catalytic subunit [Desulfobacteraceae bacterium]MBT7086300.1 aspartate carbamoyltransferase catalytic subunit [Desulfobacterales bacterium]MBT7697167.1 aspartate carbamoyltransferase catalytic subunit [Desulfobacterales bacterium]